jgi:hypothetical protein
LLQNNPLRGLNHQLIPMSGEFSPQAEEFLLLAFLFLPAGLFDKLGIVIETPVPEHKSSGEVISIVRQSTCLNSLTVIVVPRLPSFPDYSLPARASFCQGARNGSEVYFGEIWSKKCQPHFCVHSF